MPHPLAAVLLLTLLPVAPRQDPAPAPAGRQDVAAPVQANSQDIFTFLRVLLPARQARVTFALTIDVVAGETRLKFGVDGATRTAPGHRFSSRITFTPPLGQKPRAYTAVSNGAQVWVQDVAAGKWMRQSFKQFDKGNNDSLFVTGLYAGLAAETLADLPADLLTRLQGKPFTPEEMALFTKEMDKDLPKELQVATETLDGAERKVFLLAPSDRPGIQVRLYLDPSGSRIERLVMGAKDEKMELTMVERILQIAPAPLDPKSFVFTPRGKQVEKVSLGED